MKRTNESLLPLSANERMSVNKLFLTHCVVGIKVVTPYVDCQSFTHPISIAFFVSKSWVTVLPTGRMTSAAGSLHKRIKVHVKTYFLTWHVHLFEAAHETVRSFGWLRSITVCLKAYKQCAGNWR